MLPRCIIGIIASYLPNKKQAYLEHRIEDEIASQTTKKDLTAIICLARSRIGMLSAALKFANGRVEYVELCSRLYTQTRAFIDTELATMWLTDFFSHHQLDCRLQSHSMRSCKEDVMVLFESNANNNFKV